MSPGPGDIYCAGDQLERKAWEALPKKGFLVYVQHPKGHTSWFKRGEECGVWVFYPGSGPEKAPVYPSKAHAEALATDARASFGWEAVVLDLGSNEPRPFGAPRPSCSLASARERLEQREREAWAALPKKGFLVYVEHPSGNLSWCDRNKSGRAVMFVPGTGAGGAPVHVLRADARALATEARITYRYEARVLDLSSDEPRPFPPEGIE